MNTDTKPSIFLMGDSIVEQCRDDEYPRWGWGMALPHYILPQYQVINHAHSGWTTNHFLQKFDKEECLWDTIIRDVKKGDWVIISLGVNDASVVNEYRTDAETYRKNLTFYTTKIREKGADVIFTTLSLRGGDADSELGWDYQLTDDPQDEDMDKRWMLRTKVLCEIAKDLNVEVMQFGAELKKIYEKMYQDYMASHKDATVAEGRNYVRFFFNLYNKPLNAPIEEGGYAINKPEKKDDSTHLSIRGAKVYARTVAKLISESGTGLAKWIDTEML